MVASYCDSGIALPEKAMVAGCNHTPFSLSRHCCQSFIAEAWLGHMCERGSVERVAKRRLRATHHASSRLHAACRRELRPAAMVGASAERDCRMRTARACIGRSPVAAGVGPAVEPPDRGDAGTTARSCGIGPLHLGRQSQLAPGIGAGAGHFVPASRWPPHSFPGGLELQAHPRRRPCLCARPSCHGDAQAGKASLLQCPETPLLAPTVDAGAGKAHLVVGRSLGIFPEGQVNRDPDHLLRGRRGATRLSLATGIPVVPMGIRFLGGAPGPPVLGNCVMQLEIGAPLVPPAPVQARAR